MKAEECECINWTRLNVFDQGHHPNCPHYETITVYKITPGKDMNPCCEKDPSMILPWLEEAAKDDKITIEVLEMTPEAYNELPEYVGP